MKKIFTLISAFALTIGMASAQRSARKVPAPHTSGLHSSTAIVGHQPYYFSRTDRDRAIRQVNYQYRSQISRVNHARFMRPYAKRQKIQGLRNWRNREINQIHAKFNSRLNRYNKAHTRYDRRRH